MVVFTLSVGLTPADGRQLLHADLAAADARPQAAGLERVRLRADELLAGVDRRQPEAELVGEVVAGAPRAVALDERRRAEVLEARAGARQRLTAAVRARSRVLYAHTYTVMWCIKL